MNRQDKSTVIKDELEYLGSTTVQRTRWSGDSLVWRDWLLFDTVAEAQVFYHDYR